MLIKRAWALIFVLSLLFPVLSFDFHENVEGNTSLEGSQVFAPTGFPPFSIDNDTALIENATNHGWIGLGTQKDPFVIKNLIIDANRTSYAVTISNTTLHLKFHNCTFLNSSSNTNTDAGLKVMNSSNIEIIDCIFNRSYNGIYSQNSEIIVRNSTFTSNGNYGISGIYSSIWIMNCKFSQNEYGTFLTFCEAPRISLSNYTDNDHGIRMNDCPNGTINGNIIKGHDGVGFELLDSDNVNILNNSYDQNDIALEVENCNEILVQSDSFISNRLGISVMGGIDSRVNNSFIKGSDNGISIYSITSRWNFTNNNILDCSYGFRLSTTNNNVIEHNRIVECAIYGIDLQWRNEDTIVNNTIENCPIGIRSYFGNSILISGNTINGSVDGIYFYYSTYNRIFDNHIFSCTEDGIELDSSQYNIIRNNTLLSNKVTAILNDNSNRNTIEENEIKNSQNGIDNNFCDNGQIHHNSIRNCGYGLISRGGDNNEIENNTIIDSSSYGAALSESHNNIIVNNSIIKSRFFGLNLISSSDNEIYSNAFAYNNKAGVVFNSSTRQAQDNFNSNRWYRNEKGNFWRDLTGPDSDSNGIVDIPYQIKGMMNQDLYPLTTTGFFLVPSNVTDLSAVPYNGKVELDWGYVLTDGGSPVLGFNIQRKNSTGKYQLINTTDPSRTSYTDLDIKNRETYTYRITAFNLIGEGPNSVAVSATPDDSVPVIDILTPTAGSFINSWDIYVSWRGTDPLSNIIEYKISFDDMDWISKGLQTDHLFQIEGSGPHNVTVVGYDSAGNHNSSTVEFVTDTGLPSLDILNMENGEWINTTSVFFEWTMKDVTSGLHHIEIRWDDVYWLDKGLATNITIKNLGEGAHIAYFKLFDNAGNEILKEINFTIDLVDPEVWFEDPEAGARVNTSSIEIEWGALDLESGIGTFMIKVDEEDWKDLGIVYNSTVYLGNDGDHAIHLKILDNAGNQRSALLDVTLDRQVPSILAFGPVGENIDPTNTLIFVQLDEFLDPNNMALSVDSILGTSIWSIDNVLSFTPHENLRYGTTYEVSISGKDLAGNLLVPFKWTFSTDDRGYVKGRILDMSNFPIKNAIITAVDDNSTGTDGAGNFEMIVVSGQKTISITAPGFLPYSKEIVVTAGETYDMGPIKLEEKVDMGSISGKVIDDDGRPILGVIITLDTGETVTTSEDGLFDFHVEVGNYTISFIRDGFERHVETAWVKKDKVVDLDDIKMESSDTGEQTSEGGLELWQLQLLIFLVIVIIGVIIIFIFMRRSRQGTEKMIEE